MGAATAGISPGLGDRKSLKLRFLVTFSEGGFPSGRQSTALRWTEVTSVRSVIERGTVLLGKYRVDSILGRGGMGLVVKAWHLGLDEQVAIKMLRDDVPIADETIARFVREAQAAVKLKNEHIARITDVGTFANGKPYMVMEYLEGQDIGQLLVERGRLQTSLAIELVIQACEALAEAHSLGIVHRDIKPTNLFLTSHLDGTVLLKILDFGISKAPSGAELSLTQTWSLLGTPAYMSPEQMRSARDVDARTDIWSLGAVLYEALEGHLPFEGGSFSEMCVMVAVDPPAPMTATPLDLVPIIARCLAKNPDERYPSMAALARDLARLAREPDKAQQRVDRMNRMTERAANRRTPPAGLPQFIPPSGSHPTPDPAHAQLPARAIRFPEMSPADGVPLVPARPYTFAVGLPQPPLATPLVPGAMGYPLPLAVPLGAAALLPPHGHGYLRPAVQAPRIAPSLMTTHVIARRDRSWVVAVTAALLAIAAAIAIVAGSHRRRTAPRPPADDRPDVIRMTPTAAPAPATGAARDASPRGPGARQDGRPAAPAPGDRGSGG
jgi:serine/threonine-protein kinase